MAILPNAFNANEVAPYEVGNYEPLPSGFYNVVIEDSEMRDTKSGTGQYLLLVLRVLDGEHANRLLWDRLNLINESERAVEIGYRTLSTICHSVGVVDLQDSSDLHNKPLQAKVEFIEGDKNYGSKNEVKGYRAADDSAMPAAKPAAAAPAGGKTPPWKKAG